MSSCCTPTGCTTETASDVCPRCGTRGVAVDPITLKALLTAEGLRRGVPASPRFCSTASCDVVYFDAAVPVTFSERELTVRVHAKHPDDDTVPVCYCFGHTPASVRDEILRSGKSTAFKTVTADVQAGHCACEVKNPKGACCLGDIARSEKRVLAGLSLVSSLEKS